jgi:hypothetical protein
MSLSSTSASQSSLSQSTPIPITATLGGLSSGAKVGIGADVALGVIGGSELAAWWP